MSQYVQCPTGCGRRMQQRSTACMHCRRLGASRRTTAHRYERMREGALSDPERVRRIEEYAAQVAAGLSIQWSRSADD